MNKLAFAVISLLSANLAMAQTVPLAVAALPLDEGGALAVAAACLAVGIRIIQRKRNR